MRRVRQVPFDRQARPCGGRYRHAVLAASLIAIAGTVGQTEEPLRIGYFGIPPHVIEVVDGRPSGAAISYFEEFIAPHFGVPFVWNSEVTPPTRLMRQLNNGEIDAMIFLGKTEERTEVFHYPDPYLVLPEIIAFRNDHPIKQITDVRDLYGLRLGFLVGGRIPEPLQDHRITYDLIAGKQLMERNVKKLLLGRIDGIYAPLSTALGYIVDDMGVGDQIRLVPIEFLDPVEIYTVFSRKTVENRIVLRYNSALSTAESKKKYSIFLEEFEGRQ